MLLVLLILLSCACLAGIEFGKRRFKLPASLTRRAGHVGTSLVAAVAPLYVTKPEIIFVSLVFAAVFYVSRRKNFLTAVHGVERNTLGEVWLPLGVVAAALIFLPSSIVAFQFGVLIMGVCDPLAGLVGEYFKFGRFTLLGTKKSIGGCAAFFVSAFLITLGFAPEAGYGIVLAAGALTAVECVLGFGLDNLALPVIGGLLYTALIG